jgi:hypothetical protein
MEKGMDNGEGRRGKSKRKKVGVNGFSWSWLLPYQTVVPSDFRRRQTATVTELLVIYSHLSVSRPCSRFSKGISHLVGQSFFT